MNIFKKTVLATALVGISSLSLAQSVPWNWSQNSNASTSNIKMYQKIGSNTYVQVVDMVGGAKIALKQVKFETKGGFNYYTVNSITNWYAASGNPQFIVNGDFFNQNINPTTISFAVRSNSQLVEPGGDPNGNKRQIEFFTGQGAAVLPASAWRMANTTAQNALGGHAPVDTPTPNAERGRTSICTVSAGTPSSPSRYFLVFLHVKATKSQVDTDMLAWNCAPGSEIIMDGSASSQMVYREAGIPRTLYGVAAGDIIKRNVPQIIAVYNN
jgi:hypothetical protein